MMGWRVRKLLRKLRSEEEEEGTSRRNSGQDVDRIV